MVRLMRCLYCGLLQDEPVGAKSCGRCGGELDFEAPLEDKLASYVQVQMELDQIAAPAGQNVERYVLVTIRTPTQVPPEELPPSDEERPALNVSAVLDVSGSMGGEKIDQAKHAVLRSVTLLHDGDIFSLVTFADEVNCPFEPQALNKRTRAEIKSALEQINAGGMTALCGGLELGIEKAGLNRQDTNLVLLLSDGQANVGETDLELVGNRAYQARKAGTLVSALGVGLDYNEALLTEIATQGGGRFYHVVNADQIPAYLAGELGEVAALAAREVKIQLTLPQGATLVPLSAAYPTQQRGDQATATVGDIPCDTELEIPMRLALTGKASGSRLSIEGMLNFRSPSGRDHTVPLNRVTVRVVDPGKFSLREGVVTPVIERVLTQMRAANVLGVARAMATKPEEAEKHADGLLSALSTYASLLGEERAEEEAKAFAERFSALRGDQASAKQAVAAAFRVQRSLKDFIN